MTIESLAAVQALPPAHSVATAEGFLPASTASAANAGPGFADAVTHGLQELNQQLMTSQVDLQQLAVGNVQNLHQVMIRLEESRTAFQLAMQVRQRLLDAYQDVMKMQL
ncbi:flagellar hook-basal body complex protein FliE [Ramlibacter sp.]|uniref:flagellar hook-basal body complex protein FliE n=1 Tax=Ramlibacter sp. TaxID=1917967 RepID=UPI0035AF338B